METRNFNELCSTQWQQGKFVCLGLDLDFTKLPVSLQKDFSDDPVAAFYRFGEIIISATKNDVGFYKPNIAFFERYGAEGLSCLRQLIQSIHEKAPDVPVIIDAKRNEIDNTNLGYVASIFDYFQADAVTVNPYLGLRALTPFFKREEKGVIVLCRTSNQESDEFQGLPVMMDSRLRRAIFFLSSDKHALDKFQDSIPHYLVVAHEINVYNKVFHNLGMVFGATYPEDLAQVRPFVGGMPILIPGIGAQSKTGNLKKDLHDVLSASFFEKTGNIIINVSRTALYASREDDYAEKCVEYIKNMNNIIADWRQGNA